MVGKYKRNAFSPAKDMDVCEKLILRVEHLQPKPVIVRNVVGDPSPK